MKDNEKQKEKKNEYCVKMLDDEKRRYENEKERKRIEEEELKLQEEFSNRLGLDVTESKKIFGFIKRYVLIGFITGAPGIALTFLFDKMQENQMIKNLYNKNIEAVSNPNNRELAKEYEILKQKFNKVYDIEKIEKLLQTSDEIERLKNYKKLREKLNEQIKKCRESYVSNLDRYIENQIIQETKEIVNEDSMEEELQIEQKVNLK